MGALFSHVFTFAISSLLSKNVAAAKQQQSNGAAIYVDFCAVLQLFHVAQMPGQ